MKALSGVLLGLVGYTAWKLSEPEPGGPADIPSRIARLKVEWFKATAQGKMAGDARRTQMEREFEAIFRK